MKVVPDQLVTTAEGCVDIAVELTKALGEAIPGMGLAHRDAGDTQGGYDVVAAHAPVIEAAQTAVESLAAVFEADADALLLCAFAYSAADETAAEGLEHDESSSPPSTLPSPPPPPPENPWPQYPSPDPAPPSPSPGPAPTPSPTPAA